MGTLTQIDNRAVCEETLAILSSHFGIEKPKLDWSYNQISGAAAFPNQNRIRMGLRKQDNNRLNDADVLLHEFSHILNHHKNIKNVPFDKKYTRSKSGKFLRVVKSHGPEFKATLFQVVQVWYGDVDKYEWKKDYKSIGKWYVAKKQILLDILN
jgi:hypothetical protein